MRKKSFLKNTPLLFFLLFLGVFFLTILFASTGNKPGQGTIQAAVNPFGRFFASLGAWTQDKFSFFGSIGSLKQESRKLVEENLELKYRLADLENIKKENQELKEQIQLAPQDKYELISAMVTGKDLSGQQEVVYLNKGEKHGIKRDMGVVVGKGVLIGKVIETFPSSCQVEFLTNQGLKVNAEIIQSGAKGITQGQFGTSFTLEMVPQTIIVNPGDSIITSGIGNSLLPRGLLIGYAQEAHPSSDQLFQSISLVSPAQAQTARIVWVVKKEKEQ